MIEFIKNIFLDNPVITYVLGAIVSTGIVGYLSTKIFVFILNKLTNKLINGLLSAKNQDYIASKLDDKVDEIQKLNPELGKEIRKDAIKAMCKLREIANGVAARLQEDDGVN